MKKMSACRKNGRPHNGLQVMKGRHFTQDQRAYLEEYFKADNYPHLMQRSEIAELIGLQQHQVSIWFANRRKKLRDEVGKMDVLVDQPPKVRRRYPSAISCNQISSNNTPVCPFSQNETKPEPPENTSYNRNGAEDIEWFLREIPDIQVLPLLPTWPARAKHVPFQQKLFDGEDLSSLVAENERETFRYHSGRNSVLVPCTETEKNQNNGTVSNKEILQNLVAKLEAIRQDTLYIPVMDEISEMSDGNNFPVDVAPSTEQVLVRSVRQFMEPSGLVKSFRFNVP